MSHWRNRLTAAGFKKGPRLPTDDDSVHRYVRRGHPDGLADCDIAVLWLGEVQVQTPDGTIIGHAAHTREALEGVADWVDGR
jgi:hypothetical protein